MPFDPADWLARLDAAGGAVCLTGLGIAHVTPANADIATKAGAAEVWRELTPDRAAAVVALLAGRQLQEVSE